MNSISSFGISTGTWRDIEKHSNLIRKAHQSLYGNTKKMSYCAGFTVCIISAKLVVIKDHFQYLRKRRGKWWASPSSWEDVHSRVRYPHRVSRIDLGGGILRASGFTIMAQKGTYFPRFLDLGWRSLENVRPWKDMAACCWLLRRTQ